MQLRKANLSEPENQDVLRRFSRSLFAQAQRIGDAIQAAERATESRPAKEVAFELGVNYRELRVLGVLLRLPPRQRHEALVLEGELSPAKAEVALKAVESLAAAPRLLEALSQVMPTWFPTADERPDVVRIYCSYSRYDEGLFQELERHLQILQRTQLVAVLNSNDDVDDVSTQKSSDAPMIRRALEDADIILFLLSVDYLASSREAEEVRIAMERHARGEARVIPVLLRDTPWRETPFGDLVPLPRNGIPVTRWQDRDSAWTEVVHGIRVASESLLPSFKGAQGNAVHIGGDVIGEAIVTGQQNVVVYQAQRAPSKDVGREPVRGLLSYASGDQEAAQDLLIRLAPLERRRQIQIWHDGMMLPGQKLATEIHRRLAEAQLILVLVTPRLLGSRWAEEEINLFLERRQHGALLVPILLEPAEWQTTPLFDLQALPRNGIPVSAWKRPALAWSEIIQGIRQAVEYLAQERAGA